MFTIISSSMLSTILHRFPSILTARLLVVLCSHMLISSKTLFRNSDSVRYLYTYNKAIFTTTELLHHGKTARLLLAAANLGATTRSHEYHEGGLLTASSVGGGFLMLCTVFTLLSVMVMIIFACGDSSNGSRTRSNGGFWGVGAMYGADAGGCGCGCGGHGGVGGGCGSGGGGGGGGCGGGGC